MVTITALRGDIPPLKGLCLIALLAGIAAPAVSADAPPTMRLDYYHSGNAKEEFFSLHRVVLEPLPWPGNPHRPVDNTGRGEYRFDVVDPERGDVLYSRGFSSIYGEWETTAEAEQLNRTFHESLRFPQPPGPVELRLYKRDRANVFQPAWQIKVDPDDMLVVRVHPPAPGPALAIQNAGPPAQKVDLLILGDGYTDDEIFKFEADARRLTEALFAVSPFRERRQDFNVWALMAPSPESGVARPSSGLHRWTPLGTRYDAFRSERYVLTFDNAALRDVAGHAPYDLIEILVNNETYGGGGIYGLYSTVAAGSAWAAYLFVHEFAHHFAGLADEYYTSPVAYQPIEPTVEPWEPNVTTTLDRSKLKWRELVAARTPLPTPWPKSEYEEYAREHQVQRAQLREQNRPESEMNDLFGRYQEFVETLFSDQKHRDNVGAFEGANYSATGFYRPAMNCVMFTRHDAFCPVCIRAIEEIIDLYATGESET